ncbi:UDP-N-acetylglucosamine 1-carboxyvinyltransferase [Streptomyces microflavus]
MSDDYLARIGKLIRDARQHRGWTQTQLAEALATSQSAVNRIERGNQNISLEMIARIGEALDSEIVSLGYSGPMHLRVVGGRRLSGAIDVKTSKNACVALLCASLLNKGRTVLRRVARIEEVFRLLEVLNSIGVRTRWVNDGVDLEIVPPAQLEMEAIDADAARRTRSIIMFLGPLLHRMEQFALPYAGGCDLGTRTIEPHMIALRRFGLEIAATEGLYHAQVDRSVSPGRPIVLTERGDTVTENALLAAARHDGTTVIRNASSNYMVQDLCFFLEALGVRVDGVGTTTLTVHGVPQIDVDVGGLGDLTGRDVLHLQCHLGTETLALARRGARAVGLDFSAASVAAAREIAAKAGVEVEYVRANVYDAVEALEGRRFDVVYTGKGALCYLPDLERWAAVVAELLRPGGLLYIVEFHPLLNSLGPKPAPGEGGLVLRHDYLGGDGPVHRDATHTYTDGPAVEGATESVEWMHGIGEVVGALTGAGLGVRQLRESDELPWPRWSRMVRTPSGWWRLPEPRIPLLYGLLATR